MNDEHFDYLEKVFKNPFYPVKVEDYPKLTKFKITIEGLKYFNELRRKLILGRQKLTENEYQFLGNLWFHYSLTNSNVKEYRKCIEHGVKLQKMEGIKPDEKTNSRLVQRGFLLENFDYEPSLLLEHNNWQRDALKKIKKNKKI